jgi:diguanylate cyclase
MDLASRARIDNMSENNLRPPDIAREALRRLAMKRVPPTPDNYRTYYHEIAGTQIEDAFPEKSLKLIAKALPRATPEQLQLANQFENAIASRQWPSLGRAIIGLCAVPVGGELSWGPLIRALVNHLEHGGTDVDVTQRRRALDQTLTAPSSPEQLFTRLQGLIATWSQASGRQKRAPTVSNPPGLAAAVPIDAPKTTSDRDSTALLARLLGHLLRGGVAPLVADNAALAEEAIELADLMSSLGASAAEADPGARMHALTRKLEWAAEDQHAVRQALLDVLRLIVENIAELTTDDEWLHGQLDVVSAAFGKPLDVRMLDEVARRLRDVIDKQGRLKRQLTDAQERLKSMLAGFVERLAELATSTCHYHATLVRCAGEIEKASDITELATVVEEMLTETRAVQETTRRSSTELGQLRSEVEAANDHIARLQRELDETSELVRHDALTGTLNRKGLDEALEREISLARRRGSPLCIALIDLDNFKLLNDTFGHKTGDDALRHLTAVMRTSLRPQDHLGRYGGEEFLILLPDTEEQSAAAVITRLQRALTKQFFMADNRRLLITFSAGIARLASDEDPYGAIDRADKAMYAAKRAGKNRVLVAG